MPGTVQAANYDTGGQGVAYNVASVNGTGNSYRSDGVDLEVCSDTGGGYDIGWTGDRAVVQVHRQRRHGRHLRLEPAAGRARRGDRRAAHRQRCRHQPDGIVAAPATGGYQTWTTVTANVTLPAGAQTLTVDQDGAGWNINYLTVHHAGGGRRQRLRWFPAGVLGEHRQYPERVGCHRVRLPQRHQWRSTPTARSTGSVNGVTESIAQSPYYDDDLVHSCRINFYLGSPTSSYHDFIELNSSGTTINADTSRVDAFGLPLAIHLHNSDGTDVVVGRGRPGLRRDQDGPVPRSSRTRCPRRSSSSPPSTRPTAIPAPGDVAAFQPGGATRAT